MLSESQKGRSKEVVLEEFKEIINADFPSVRGENINYIFKKLNQPPIG